jgi:hypothetical protein
MSDTIRENTWAIVRLLATWAGDGRLHHPAEDGSRVLVTVTDRDGDHSVFALYKGRAWKNAPLPPGGLGIGRRFRPDELEPILEPR